MDNIHAHSYITSWLNCGSVSLLLSYSLHLVFSCVLLQPLLLLLLLFQVISVVIIIRVQRCQRSSKDKIPETLKLLSLFPTLKFFYTVDILISVLFQLFIIFVIYIKESKSQKNKCHFLMPTP